MADDSSRTRAAPPWLRDGFAAMWHEVRAYTSTTWALTRSPHAFADAWWSGARPAMNPLAMLATGATLVAAARQLAGAVLDIPHPDSLVGAIASALGPYVHYIVLGILCHVVLVAFAGDRRVRLTDTIALALFAGAGPAAIAEVVGWLVLCALAPLGVDVSDTMLSVMLGAAFTVFCAVLATAFGGLHRPSGLRIMFAFAVAFPVTGLAFGYLHPPGSYGLHWVMSFDGGFQLGLGM